MLCLLLLSIQEDLLDIVIVEVINVANVRSLNNGDWLWLLLLLLLSQLRVCGKMCLGLNYRRGMVLLERRSVLL